MINFNCWSCKKAFDFPEKEDVISNIWIGKNCCHANIVYTIKVHYNASSEVDVYYEWLMLSKYYIYYYSKNDFTEISSGGVYSGFNHIININGKLFDKISFENINEYLENLMIIS